MFFDINEALTAISHEVRWRIVLNGVEVNLRRMEMRDAALCIDTDSSPREYISLNFLMLRVFYFAYHSISTTTIDNEVRFNQMSFYDANDGSQEIVVPEEQVIHNFEDIGLHRQNVLKGLRNVMSVC